MFCSLICKNQNQKDDIVCRLNTKNQLVQQKKQFCNISLHRRDILQNVKCMQSSLLIKNIKFVANLLITAVQTLQFLSLAHRIIVVNNIFLNNNLGKRCSKLKQIRSTLLLYSQRNVIFIICKKIRTRFVCILSATN